jgi:hypothetical protein
MSSFTMAVTIVGVLTLALYFFAKYWNKNHDK